MPDLDQTPATGALAQLHADWAARGWAPADLHAFRMESDTGPADLPDLNAILDGAPDAPDAPADAPADPAPAPDAPADAPAPAPVDEPAAKTGLDALPEEWQKEVREAREEAKRYRLRAKDYDDVYGDLDDDGRSFLLELNKAVKAGDVTTAQQMWDALFTGDDPATPAGADSDADAPAAGLTPADVERMVEEKLAAREAERQREQAIADIDTEAETLGFKPGTRDYVNLLYVANNETNGDLAAAAESIKADRQKVIDEFLAAKAQDSEKHTTPAATNGAAPSGERQITDLKHSRSALEEYLAEL